MSKKNKSNNYSTSLSALSPIISAQPIEVEPSHSTYRLVVSKDLNTFTESVNNLLKQGWSLQGGIDTSAVSTPYETVLVYSQALVKIS
jgi:hypothetical protein